MSDSAAPIDTPEAADTETIPNLNSKIWAAFGMSLVLPLLLVIFYGAAPYWLNHNIGVQNGQYFDYASLTWGASSEMEPLRQDLEQSGILIEYKCLSVCFFTACGLTAFLIVGQIAVYFLNQHAKSSDEALVSSYKLAWGLTISMALVNVALQIPLMGYGSFELTVLAFQVYFVKLIFVIVIGGIAVLWQAMALLLKSIPMEFREPMSRELTPEDAPELWEAVRAAAAQLQIPPPDKIIAGLQFNFYVTELDVIHDKGRSVGRTLYVSYPLLRQLSQKELLAIIGHEMGHFQGKDTVLTNKFYPLKRKVLGTLFTMAQGGWMGWPSRQVVSFFFYCFEGTSSARSRVREFHADAVGASLTSTRIAAQALVKVHVFMEAFNRAMKVYVKNPASNPLEMDLKADVRTNYMANNDFWDSLFKQKMPHPLDSHPPLKDRLEALGERSTSREAQIMFLDEDPHDMVPLRHESAVFAELSQQATAQVEKIRNVSLVKEADYETPEGKAILDEHFPPKEWKGREITNAGPIIFFSVMTGALILGMFLIDNTAWRATTGVLAGICLVIGAMYYWAAHTSGDVRMEMNAGGIKYSKWSEPLVFKDVSALTLHKESGKLKLIFKRPKKKTLNLRVNFYEGKPDDLAQIVYDYYKRQER